MSIAVTAEMFVDRLLDHRSEEDAELQRHFRPDEGEGGGRDVFIGVRMGQVFGLAKEFVEMPLAEIEQLLESPIHEVRAGALSIMGKQASARSTPQRRRQELYELYLRRTDRINDWDLVDISCHHVVGRDLFDKPRMSSTSSRAPSSGGSGGSRCSAPCTSSDEVIWTTPRRSSSTMRTI